MTSDLAQAELIAVLVAVTGNEPRVMTVRGGEALPSGPFESRHRSLQAGLRAWIERQTGHPVGYLEQLYTFADRDRDPLDGDTRRISIGYLGLVQEAAAPGPGHPQWRGWYDYFPWEDHRTGRPAMLARLTGALGDWAGADGLRRQRLDFLFGLNGMAWNEDMVLQRYEMMFEAGLAETPACPEGAGYGQPMAGDHRRILATGLARLRAKIKYHPVVFELMPDSFTLLHLQRTVEALSGLSLHKPNFRRQMDQQNLIEETGAMSTEARGRPAKLFRFRPAVLEARAMTGARLPVSRS